MNAIISILFVILAISAVVLFFVLIAAIAALAVICVVRANNCKPASDAKLKLEQEETDRSRAYAERMAQLIRCETVSSREDEDKTKFLEMHKVLEELFPNVHRVCEKTEIRGNLLFKWAGKSSEKPIMLMSHHDVVEAPGRWSHEPFSGDIADGKLWGRGTQDTKGSLFCFFSAVEELIESGFTPENDIYLASSCTEEISGEGGPLIAEELKRRGVKLFMLIDEGGAILNEPIGGVRGTFALLGVLEKGYGDLKFTAHSSGGHASAPKKGTPIPQLAKFVCSVERRDPFKSQLHPTAKEMFSRMTPFMDFKMRLIFANLWLFKPLILALMPKISAQGAAMLKTTCAFTTAQGSNGLNVLPQEAFVTANMRFIHHQPTDESIEIITKRAEKFGLETTVMYKDYPQPIVDHESRQFAMVEEAVHEVYGNIGVCPYPMTGGTDCKFYRDVTEHAIRFSPIHMDAQQLSSIHGLDENITIAAIPDGVDFYKAIIKKA